MNIQRAKAKPCCQLFPGSTWGAALLAAWLAFGWLGAASADETKKQPANQASAADAPQPTARELMSQIMHLARRPPQGNNKNEMLANFKAAQREIIDIADKVLAHPETADERADALASSALRHQLKSLRTLVELGDRQAFDEMKPRIEKHAGDKRPRMAAAVRQAGLRHRFTPPPEADAAALTAIAADAKQYFAGLKPLGVEHVMLMKGVADALQERDADAQARDLLTTFGELLAKSDDKRLVHVGQIFTGSARRLGLLGQPMEVYGTQLDGKQIDWASYRGKVVLIDFWATWCPPCMAEMPHLLKEYERYHDRGFEVIGFSADENRTSVEAFIAQRKIPWVMAMKDDFQGTGKEMSLGDYYGISAYPTAILVDKEGQVVSLNARGPELKRRLEQLLGPAEEKKKKDVP